MDRCNICGTKLIEIDGKKICPNHGIVEEKQEIKQEETKINYIG